MGRLHTSFGIDFRQNHLVLALLKKFLGGIRLVDALLHPIPPEDHKEDREAQVINLINGFILKHRIRKDAVCLSIPGEKSIVRFLRLPASTKENLRKVLEYETSRYTPFEKEDVYFDFYLLGEDKTWLSLVVIYVKRSEVDPYLSLLKKIGIQPSSIQIPSISAINLFSYHRSLDQKEISVLVEVSQPYYEINLLQGNEWKESLHLPIASEGERFHPIDLIRRSLLGPNDLSQTHFYVYGIDGDETLISNLTNTFGLKAVSEPPAGRMKLPKDFIPYSKIYPSLGVPLREMVVPRVDLNLLPDELRRKKRKIGKPILIILFALFLLVGLNQGASLYRSSQTELHSVTEEITKRKPEVEALERLQKEKEALLKEMAELEKIRSDEVSKIEILKELTRQLPDTVWIWNLKYNGKEVDMTGYADSASDLISLLDQSPLFEKVEFLSPVTKERFMRPEGPQEKERFRIKAKLEGRKPGG